VARVKGEYLTPGITGGRLNAYMLDLDPGDSREIEYDGHGGEEGVYVLAGRVRYRVGDREYTMSEGDALHYPADRPHGMQNVGEGPAKLLMVSTKRVRRGRSSNGATGRTH
jgi:quercetin dioxygenase-like cupin family protein